MVDRDRDLFSRPRSRPDCRRLFVDEKEKIASRHSDTPVAIRDRRLFSLVLLRGDGRHDGCNQDGGIHGRGGVFGGPGGKHVAAGNFPDTLLVSL